MSIAYSSQSQPCNGCPPMEPFCTTCGSNCDKKTDAACTVYHLNTPNAINHLTCLGLPNGVTIETFMETVDAAICNGITVTPIVNVFDTITIDMSGNGTTLLPIKGDVNISAEPQNLIEINPDGLFASLDLNNLPADLLLCLGLTALQWDNSTPRDKIIAIIRKMCACCSGSPCGDIDSPDLISDAVDDAVCPFDLTSWVSDPGAGFTIEWHTSNDTSSGTLVPDPTEVSTGIYYAFTHETSTGCFSQPSTLEINCAEVDVCSEPLNLSVIASSDTTTFITFDSAIVPPPSYLVKRRLASAADIPGNYITIGAPVFNGGTNKWEITDTTATSNVLYVYKAESQCADNSHPFAVFTFGRLICPELTTSFDGTNIDYSFVPVGGGITKYEVKIYDSTGTTLIATNTHLPAFTNPTTGTFTGLTLSTEYLVKIVMFIGTFSKICPGVEQHTNPDNYSINIGIGPGGSEASFNVTIDGQELFNGVMVFPQTITGYSPLLPCTGALIEMNMFSGSTVSVAEINSILADAVDGGVPGARVHAIWNSLTISTMTLDFST